jgi:prepilin-type N-terminal cleavage/methylation domain-containing protein
MAMQSSFEEKRGSQAGLTLIELLVGMTITGIITAMLVMGWINLQSTSAYALASNDARATARDSLSRISSEIRDCQPTALPTASPSPTATPALFTVAQPMEADFYSVYNQAGAATYGNGTGGLHLTRLWLDTSGSKAQKTLYWQRDTNGNGAIDAGDHKMILGTNIVNNSIQNTNVSPTTTYTAIFTYWYLAGSGALVRTDTVTGANLAQIVAVQVRIIVDANLQRRPLPVDITTTVRLRNVTAK